MPNLTTRVVEAIEPNPAVEVMVWDAKVRGFGVRVMPSGVATYLVKYRNREGRLRKLALGRTTALTPDEARALARQRLGEVARGGDPSAERSQLRRSMTVGDLCDLYLADAEHRVKASTRAMDRSRIDRHVQPLLGARTVLSVTPQDVAKLQADIISGKTGRARIGRGGVTTGGKGVASRTVGMLSTILAFAVTRGIIAENPARNVTRVPDGKQQRFLSMDEIGRFGHALQAARDDREGDVALDALRFLLLTGCRRMEALTLRLDWVDAPARCIRFPDTKSGFQVRAIGAAAVRALPSGRAGWAFPSSRGDGHFVGLPKVLDRICERAGLEGVTVHVLRHSFGAAAAEMGFSELTIAGLLGHTMSGVTARYAHVADSALVSAADRVASRIAAALAGNAVADVIDLTAVRAGRTMP